MFTALKKYTLFLWNSHTFTTWGSMFTRLGGTVIVIPLILRHFSAGETAIWFLFANIITLGNLADFGFSTTFTRVTAYAMGGASKLADFRGVKTSSQLNRPNWEIMGKLYGNIGFIYLITSVVAFIALILAGTLSLIKPIANIHGGERLWVAWAVVCVGVSISFYGRKYDSVLRGLNYISLVNRFNILFGFLGTLNLIIVILVGGDILHMVITNQAWSIVNMIRNRFLLMSVENRRFRSFPSISFDKEIFRDTWAPSWRQAILIACSTGVTELSGVIYAQVADVSKLASYLLALKFINFVSEFSQAPFYSKIPLFSKLRAAGSIKELSITAGTAMKRSLLIFILCSLIVGLGADFIFELLKSKSSFVPVSLWSFMVVTWVLERHHAMHAQIYCTTNHIPFYVPVSISGVLSVILTYALIPSISFWAFPVSKFLTNAMINNWWNVKISLNSINERFFPFFKQYVAQPTILLFITIIVFFTKFTLLI